MQFSEGAFWPCVYALYATNGGEYGIAHMSHVYKHELASIFPFSYFYMAIRTPFLLMYTCISFTRDAEYCNVHMGLL